MSRPTGASQVPLVGAAAPRRQCQCLALCFMVDNDSRGGGVLEHRHRPACMLVLKVRLHSTIQLVIAILITLTPLIFFGILIL